MIKTTKAGIENLPEILPLFNAYRVFYGQSSDVPSAKKFLLDRISKNESVIFLAMYDRTPAGFIQLYSTFSSVSLKPVYILNDLYVDPIYRKKGIGEALLNEAKLCCTQVGYKGLALETAIDNPAQKLYERLGWQKDSHCFHYFWSVKTSN